MSAVCSPSHRRGKKERVLGEEGGALLCGGVDIKANPLLLDRETFVSKEGSVSSFLLTTLLLGVNCVESKLH